MVRFKLNRLNRHSLTTQLGQPQTWDPRSTNECVFNKKHILPRTSNPTYSRKENVLINEKVPHKESLQPKLEQKQRIISLLQILETLTGEKVTWLFYLCNYNQNTQDEVETMTLLYKKVKRVQQIRNTSRRYWRYSFTLSS